MAEVSRVHGGHKAALLETHLGWPFCIPPPAPVLTWAMFSPLVDSGMSLPAGLPACYLKSSYILHIHLHTQPALSGCITDLPVPPPAENSQWFPSPQDRAQTPQQGTQAKTGSHTHTSPPPLRAPSLLASTLPGLCPWIALYPEGPVPCKLPDILQSPAPLREIPHIHYVVIF